MTPHALLLVPAPDLLGLLAPALGRFHPPTACQAVADEPWSLWCGDEETCVRALVLAWDGEPVPEGMDRAHRFHKGWGEQLHSDATIERVVELSHRFQYFGTLIALDAEGREL